MKFFKDYTSEFDPDWSFGLVVTSTVLYAIAGILAGVSTKTVMD